NGTSLRGIGRMNIENFYPLCFGFILNKAAQFIKGPAVKARAQALAAFDPFSDIFQILQHNLRAFISFSFQDKHFSNTVIDIFDMAPLAAGDLPQPLLCRLRTVALKALPMSQKLISFPFQGSSSTQFASRGSSQIIFSYIDSHHVPIRDKRNFWQFQNQIKKPAFSLT